MPIHALFLVGLAQIVSIGSLFYVYPVLAASISTDIDVPVSWLFGLLTASILLAGPTSPWIGRMIDRHGAYRLILAGSMLGAFALALLGLAQDLVILGIALFLLQIASNLTMYEAIFPALMQINEARARRLVSEITLFGGFSSTVFWPLTPPMVEALGWRGTFFAFAALNLLFCVPAYAYALRDAKPLSRPRSGEQPTAAAMTISMRKPLILMTIAICFVSFSQQAINYGFVPAMVAHGVTPGNIALVSAIVGPLSVIARILDVAFGQRIQTLHSMIGCVVLLTVAFFIPWIAPAGSLPGFLMFAVLFGTGQGIFAVVRGTLPLDFFGSSGYGARLGIINAYRRYVIASSPFLFSFAIEQVGAGRAFGMLGLMSLVGLAFFCVLRRPRTR